MRRNTLYGLWIAVLVAVLIGTGIVTAQSGGLNYRLEPVYDILDLEHGFLPDPKLLPEGPDFAERDPQWDNWIVTDNEVNVRAQSIGSDCRGYTSSAPTYRLNWRGSSSRLRIFFESVSDTTLIINDARGRWLCNDDSFSTANPTITITRPPEGQYDIWVGSYSNQSSARGVLTITERDLHP